MDTDTVITEAEALLTAQRDALLAVRPRECVLCYTHRMLVDYGCRGLRWPLHYRDQRAPRATALARRLARVGGYCDCEIFLNGYTLRSEHCIPARTEFDGEVYTEIEEEWPDPFPACHGVGRGSAKPCTLWRRW